MNYKIIEEHPLYSVSDTGHVKNNKSGRILKERVNRTSSGYKTVSISVSGIPKMIKIHRLVARYFLPDFHKDKQVNHKDGDKLNNDISNLEMTTCRENISHYWKDRQRESKYLNVCKTKNGKKWRCTIRYEGKLIHIGTFETEIDAYNARVQYEKDNNIINKYSN